MGFYSIAIDGPSGAGKSTIAKRIAKQLGYIYVDTGAMYRAMALYFLRNNIKPTEKEKLEEACKEVDISIRYVDGEQQVLLGDENVNAFIRAEEVGKMASNCSINPNVRIKLVELQRKLAAKENVVMDGRDIATHVLPNANLKIYLTASSSIRAKRRYDELMDKGIDCNFDEIEADIIDRDYRDMNRDISPLRQAEDAILVDSSEMTLDEVTDKIISLFSENVEVIE
ncbi:(d)CMP kinase [Clostridium sp. Marseille-P299]|uniref:(d)CMP kinase n=1 Tax=Clostridium sp. Marseille-P299 TaxID=1805477 RepID=UPI0008370317|nr:(d)CMP kinase [Clostridium sp. Marseille-P299]